MPGRRNFGGMRWTNYFEHPGDNRYYVFSFADESEAESFRSRLEARGIAFEAHHDAEEREPYLFGVHRRFFREALHENHLVKAATRTKFIPVAGLRWLLLVGTAAAVGLAVLGFFRTAQAQGGWEFAVEGGWLPAVDALGAATLSAETDSVGKPYLGAHWTPTGGSRFAVRLTHPLNTAWRISTGLTVQRMGADWDLAFEDVDGIGNRTGQIVESTIRLRGVRYRLPVLATTTVRLTEQQRVLAGAGLGADFTPSDVFAATSTQIDSAYHDVQVAENRTRLWNVPLLVELGWEFRPDGAAGWNPNATGSHAIRGVYLGLHWSRELFQTRWGEAVWKYQLSEQRTRLWMNPTAVAFVLRLTLS